MSSLHVMAGLSRPSTSVSSTRRQRRGCPGHL